MSRDSYTEEQAQSQYCFKSIENDQFLQNHCVGSKCMAWRWSQAKATQAFRDDAVAYAKQNNVTIPKAMDAVYKENGGRYERTEGYCGLAGYPHNAVKP